MVFVVAKQQVERFFVEFYQDSQIFVGFTLSFILNDFSIGCSYLTIFSWALKTNNRRYHLPIAPI
jgi:hypothetical protein